MNSIYPKVTIMIPTYNQENYISEAIESALSQDYENLEIIVTDDCSTDRTAEIAKSYEKDPRFMYIRNQKNLGRVANYHSSLYYHAKGDWVINLDGDDYFIDSTFITTAMNLVMTYNNVVCFLGSKHVDSKKYDKYEKIGRDSFLLDGKKLFLNWFELGTFAHASTLYRRDIVLKDGLCYTFPGLQADAHGIIRYLPFGNVIVSKVDSYMWRNHGNNASFSKNDDEFYEMTLNCHKAIIRDMYSGLITQEEGKQWLMAGELKAKKTLITNKLMHDPTVKNLISFFSVYDGSFSGTVVLFKSILRLLGKTPITGRGK